MLIGLLVSWVVGGLVIGALGRLVVPGHARMGIGATILVGIAGSFAGGLVGLVVGGGFLVRFLASVAGAALIVSAMHGRRHLAGRSRAARRHGLPGGGGTGADDLASAYDRARR